jgi:hypothetical protein
MEMVIDSKVRLLSAVKGYIPMVFKERAWIGGLDVPDHVVCWMHAPE